MEPYKICKLLFSLSVKSEGCMNQSQLNKIEKEIQEECAKLFGYYNERDTSIENLKFFKSILKNLFYKGNKTIQELSWIKMISIGFDVDDLTELLCNFSSLNRKTNNYWCKTIWTEIQTKKPNLEVLNKIQFLSELFEEVICFKQIQDLNDEETIFRLQRCPETEEESILEHMKKRSTWKYLFKSIICLKLDARYKEWAWENLKNKLNTDELIVISLNSESHCILAKELLEERKVSNLHEDFYKRKLPLSTKKIQEKLINYCKKKQELSKGNFKAFEYRRLFSIFFYIIFLILSFSIVSNCL